MIQYAWDIPGLWQCGDVFDPTTLQREHSRPG